MTQSHGNGQTGEAQLGVAIIGLGGAVATTAVAGNLLVSKGVQDTAGLPLAEFDQFDLHQYRDIRFAGWDIYDDTLYDAAVKHKVLTPLQLAAVEQELKAVRPWPAVSNPGFCSGVTNGAVAQRGLREQIATIQSQLRDFALGVDGKVVVINLASTEHAVDMSNAAFQRLEAFEAALDADSDLISPAMLYAYAAIEMGIPYGNFTPSMAADVPALQEFAVQQNVPVAGKDGKTGQTFVKTVVAPALRARALHVDGWFSTNILGNRDGQALEKPESLQSKINTKGSVLDSCLNYKVDNHIVHIHYYKPRGDNKEAWDNIDVTGFLGQQMQIKINFLCKDSILAAPLVIEIARCLDLARRKDEGGALEALGVFFKAPMTTHGKDPEHRFNVQQQQLLDWLQRLSQKPTVHKAQFEESDTGKLYAK